LETKQIKPPVISKETQKEMAAFFAKTSIPRIMENMMAGEKRK
jgi:hypothetical protein